MRGATVNTFAFALLGLSITLTLLAVVIQLGRIVDALEAKKS